MAHEFISVAVLPGSQSSVAVLPEPESSLALLPETESSWSIIPGSQPEVQTATGGKLQASVFCYI
jgi:hypothetical protein